MTFRPLHRRVARLETIDPSAWSAWAKRPLNEWPDAALESYLRDTCRAELGDSAHDAPIPDDALERISRPGQTPHR